MKRGVLALVGLCSGLLAGETSTACGRGPVAPNNVVCEGTNRVVRAALASVPEVVYVTRAAFAADHHNTATIFQCGEINERSYRTQGALKAWNPATGATRVIVPEKAGRTIRDPEVDWDGRRIVFSMRDGRADDYHIYVVNADGTGLRQLTRAKGVSDIDPAFLPDGDIVFSSTRDPKYCMCNRHIMCNLYRMEADGANIHQIGVSTLFEGHASILPDGRVLYDRWEYVDRDFGDAQGLWTCNPDGTRHAIWWGNNTTSPGGVINARAVGGDSSKAIAVLGSCHDRPWGALGLIDRSLGVDGQEPVLRTWPASYRARIHAGGKEDFDSSKSLACKYADPFPIDESHFLAVRQTGRADEMSLVYLDLDGNETELLADAPGIWSPVILRPTKKPVVQSRQRNFDAPDAPGKFYVQNVYIGTHMQGVKPGAVKALRVVESPPKRNWTGPRGWFGHGEEAAAMNWHSFENKRILGTVPVEADGSAYFEVPGNTFVYFQALDAQGKMVQSMRSGVNVQPGETYGCVGCHEKRVGEAAPVTERPLAMRRAPSKMNGWYGPARLFSFQKEVQPVLTKHCVSCHDYGKKAGNKLNLSGDRGAFFCTSYVDLWATGAITCIGGGPAEIQPAYSWGAHASKLTRTLYGHGKAKLTDEERDRVITWMDINAVYYPRYESAYPDNPGGRMPLSFKEKERLEKLCGVKIENSHSKRQREQLNFDRPELSRILEGVKGRTRDEALTIIQKGAARLKATPRGDVEEGFVPCAKDRERAARSERRRAEERRVYEAIRAGRKVYDEAACRLPASAAPKAEVSFKPGAWSTNDWILVKSPRFDYMHGFVQREDGIENECPPVSGEEVFKKHGREVYSAMVHKDRFGIGQTVSSTMSFDWRMAPLIVLAEKLERSESGEPTFGAHWEVVLYDEGVNVWHHTVKDGKPFWYLAAYLKVPFARNTRHDLKVKVSKTRKGVKVMEVSCGGHEFGYVDNDLPDSFYAGVIGCEGRNRFYAFSVK